MVHIGAFIRPVSNIVVSYLGTSMLFNAKNENLFGFMPLNRPVLNAIMGGVSTGIVSMTGETITALANIAPKSDDRDLFVNVQYGLQPFATGVVATGLSVINDYVNTKQWGFIEPLKTGALIGIGDIVGTYTLEQFKVVVPSI
jgi:amino acid permease